VGFAALRGAQDTTTPLKISAASNLFNAIVDPILIFACSLGVTGAAVATALAEAPSVSADGLPSGPPPS
jgi:Na+-driven multidrug efflux pump